MMFFVLRFISHLREKNFERLANAQIPRILLLGVTGCSPLPLIGG